VIWARKSRFRSLYQASVQAHDHNLLSSQASFSPCTHTAVHCGCTIRNRAVLDRILPALCKWLSKYALGIHKGMMLELLGKSDLSEFAVLTAAYDQPHVCHRIVLVAYDTDMSLRFCPQDPSCPLAFGALSSRSSLLHSSLR